MRRFTHFIITLALTAAVLLTIAPRSAMAASASVSGESTVRPGNSVTLTLSVDSSIMGLEGTFTCGSGLTLTNYDKFNSGWTLDFNATSGGYHFIAYGANPDSNRILSVTLKVADSLAAGTALTASFTNLVASDGSDIPLSSVTWNGSTGAALRNDAKLYGITCTNATLSPAFSSDVFTYTATVPYATEKLEGLDYFRNNNGSKVSVSGNALAVGENTITFKVVSEDGSRTNYYKLIITRQPDPNYKKSDDASLSALGLSVGDLTPAFAPGVTDYAAYVPFETKALTVSATAASEKAAGVTGAGEVTLSEEDETLLTVTCTAEDGVSRQSYTVHVVRMPAYEGVLPTITLGEAAPECTCGAAEGEAHAQDCPLYVAPQEPVHKPGTWTLPAKVNLPLVGGVSLLAVATILGVLLLIVVFLLGYLLGQPKSDAYEDDDYDDGGPDDDQPEEEAPEAVPQPKAAPVVQPVIRQAPAAPIDPAAPVAFRAENLEVPRRRKMVLKFGNDQAEEAPAQEQPRKQTPQPPQPQQPQQPQQPTQPAQTPQPAKAKDVPVGLPVQNDERDVERMSLDELLRDIKNM